MTQVIIHGSKAKVSKEEGNGLVKKDDGLYVSNTGVSISEAEGNIIKTKDDGLYASIDESVPTATEEKTGLVKPGTTTVVSTDGDLDVNETVLTEDTDIDFVSIKDEFATDTSETSDDIDFSEVLDGE